MKMNIFYLFLTVLFIICNPINAFFKPNEFCKKTATKKSCMAFNCGTNYCVYDESSCTNLISWGISMKKYAKEPKMYRNFLSRIKNCEQSDYKNQWSHRFSFG
jgi:hypothetical protein